MENFPDINKMVQQQIAKNFNAITTAKHNALKYSSFQPPTFKFNVASLSSYYNFDEIFSKTNITNISKTFNYNSQNLLKITEQFRKNLSKQVKINLPPIYKSVQIIDSWTEITNDNGIVKMHPDGLKVESYFEIYTTPESDVSSGNNTDTLGTPPKEYNKEVYRDIINKLTLGSLEPTWNWYLNNLINQDLISQLFILIILSQIAVAIATAEKITDKLDDE